MKIRRAAPSRPERLVGWAAAGPTALALLAAAACVTSSDTPPGLDAGGVPSDAASDVAPPPNGTPLPTDASVPETASPPDTGPDAGPPDAGSRAWGVAVRLSSTLFRVSSTDAPSVAMDGTGGAFAVWNQRDSSGAYRVYVSHAKAGAAWDAPFVLAGLTLDAFAPAIAADAAGNAIAAWHQYVDLTPPLPTSYHLFVARFSSVTGTWSGSTEVHPLGNPIGAPALAMTPSGDAILAWPEMSNGANSWQPWAARFAAAAGWPAGWGAPTLIGPGCGQEPLGLGVDDAGNAVAMWQGPGYNSFDVTGSAWRTATQQTRGGHHVAAAMSPTGFGLALWRELPADGGPADDVMAITYGSGNWGTSVRLAVGVPIVSGSVGNPLGAAASSTWAVADWPGTMAMYAANAWGTPTPLAGGLYGLSVAAGHGGDVFLAGTGGASGAKALHRLGTDAVWSAPEAIDTPTATDGQGTTQTAIAVDPKGNATAVWTRNNASGAPEIWANQFR
jgi:hypothetical protein